MITSHCNWIKHKENPVMPAEKVGPSAPCVIDMGDGTYRMYYHYDLNDGLVGIGIAVADAKTSWKWSSYDKNPVFSPEDNNINAFDSGMVRYCRVVRFSEKVWHMYYTGNSRKGSSWPLYWNPGMAKSMDGGLTWTRVPEYQLPCGKKEMQYSIRGAVATFVWGPEESLRAGLKSPWNMWYTAFEREPWPTMLVGICHAVSEDGIHWIPYAGNPVMRADDPFSGADGEKRFREITEKYKSCSSAERLKLHQQYSRVWCVPWVIYDTGVLKMWHTKWGVAGRQYRVCYAESKDGIHWDTDIDAIEVDVSPNGWDSDRTEYPCVIKSEKEWRLWYCGNGFAGIGYATAVNKT